MRALFFLILFLISDPTKAYGTTWFHGTNDSDLYHLENAIKSEKLLPKHSLSHPSRVSIERTLTKEEKAEILLKHKDKIRAINASPDALYAQDLVSRWDLNENQRKWFTYGMYGTIPLIITVWGSAAWDWGERGIGFGVGGEGWFGKDTYTGGADKFGHMYSLYFQKRAMTSLFYYAGWDKDTANLLGVGLSSLVGVGLEVGDGFSRFKFSFEDLVVDALGITFGYFADKYPWFDELFSLKLEWWLSHEYRSPDNKDKTDITSDYNGMKFFFSTKASGIPRLNEHWSTRYLTFDVGYYTRGYEPDLTPEDKLDNDRQRFYQVGLGLNLSQLIFDAQPESKVARTASVLTKYWVPPKTSYGYSNQID